MAKKLFLGARLKRLRRERGLQQSAMAAELGISPSYLNHRRRTPRPVTAGILLRLAEAFEVDIRQFASESGEQGSAEQLAEVFADPMFADLQIGRQEILDLSDHSPAIAEGVSRLYTALRERRMAPLEAGVEDERALITSETWVRDFNQARFNHFPELEEGAQTLAGAHGHPLAVSAPLPLRLNKA